VSKSIATEENPSATLIPSVVALPVEGKFLKNLIRKAAKNSQSEGKTRKPVEKTLHQKLRDRRCHPPRAKAQQRVSEWVSETEATHRFKVQCSKLLTSL
jgi:hypothetical protein